MALRKIKVTLNFIADVEADNLIIDKLGAEIFIANCGNGRHITSSYENTNQLLTNLNVLLNRWNTQQSRKITLTQAQWNNLKSFIQSLQG